MIKKKLALLFIILSGLYASSCTNPNYNVYHSSSPVENLNVFASKILSREFETIERVLNILGKATSDLKEGEYVSKETLYGIIDIINNFSDKSHQEKEDKILFPFLKTIQDGEKIDFLGQLLLEHVQARDKIRELTIAINSLYQGQKEKKRIAKISSSYIKLMKRHMKNEERALFPWMDATLNYDDQIMLIKDFEAMEKEDIAVGIHEHYSAMIEDLEKQLGIFPEG